MIFRLALSLLLALSILLMTSVHEYIALNAEMQETRIVTKVANTPYGYGIIGLTNINAYTLNRTAFPSSPPAPLPNPDSTNLARDSLARSYLHNREKRKTAQHRDTQYYLIINLPSKKFISQGDIVSLKEIQDSKDGKVVMIRGPGLYPASCLGTELPGK